MRLMIMMISKYNSHDNNVPLSTVHAWLLGVSGCCCSYFVGFWQDKFQLQNFTETLQFCWGLQWDCLPSRLQRSHQAEAIKLFANDQKLLVVPWTVCSKLQHTFVARYGHRVGDLSKYVAMERSSVKDSWIFCSLGTFHFVSHDPGDIQLTAVLAYCPACHLTFDAHLWNFILTSQIRGPENHHATLQQTWRNTVVREEDFPVAIGCGQLRGGEQDRTPSLLQLGDLQRYVIFSTSISVSRVNITYVSLRDDSG